MEIRLIFDKKEPLDKFFELKNKYNFDDRNGLNYVMVGVSWSEIEDENRLIHQIERNLNLNLSLLDYWNDEVYDNELEIEQVLSTLKNLKTKLEENQNFYKKIKYGFDIEKRYLKNEFSNDVNFLIDRLEMNKNNGAKKLKYDTE